MYDVIIVGAGCAGMTAGLYAARADMSVVVIEKVFPGGQIARTHLVENYPGFPEGISGVDLAMKIKEQAEKHGAVIETATVTGYDLEGDVKKIITEDKIYEGKTVVLAMGADYRELGLHAEKKFVGAGVSYCATCDGAFFRGMDVAVVGGGDTALEDAIYLSKFVNKVYVIHRRDELRAQKALQKSAMNNEKIEFVWDSLVDNILGENKVEGLRVRNKKTQEMRTIPLSGVFVAIGMVPATEEVRELVKTDAGGYIVVDSWTRTSLPGVYAAGDIAQKALRQVVTATADGATAIYAAQAYIIENE